MTITNVLPTIAVVDLEVAGAWYERLFGRPADRAPMAGLLEWDLSADGGIQIWTDAAKAGHTMATFGVASLDATTAELAERGLSAAFQGEGDNVTIATYADPDGNQLTFAEPR